MTAMSLDDSPRSLRYLIPLFLCGVFILLIGSCVLVWETSSRVKLWKKFRKIDIGMTQQEVEGILGGPPGIYHGDPSASKIGTIALGPANAKKAEPKQPTDSDLRTEMWYFPPHGWISVAFDKDDRVVLTQPYWN